jgi:hypothetical protein
MRAEAQHTGYIYMSIMKAIDLSGIWGFELDPDSVGESEEWYKRSFPRELVLPGTLDDAMAGFPNNDRAVDHLSRLVTFTGDAWYGRDVDVPEGHEGNLWDISFERCLWQTSLWVDQQLVGTRDSLQTPHVYRVALGPGRRRIVLRVDNRRQYSLHGHAYSPGTQTIWNGVLGRMIMVSVPLVSIDDAQVYPSVDEKLARIDLTIQNLGDREAQGQLNAGIRGRDGAVFTSSRAIIVSPGSSSLRMTVALGEDARLWDEFTPFLYDLELDLVTDRGTSRRNFRFGLREVKVVERRILVNGRRIFLRGEHDAGGDAIHGHPPMEIDSWRSIFGTAKRWGINHFRFHSWCPPEAAFDAADELGIYLQPELPISGSAPADDRTLAYVDVELNRILRSYGNHPSFLLFSNGNELSGDTTVLRKLVAKGQAMDPRHIYAIGSNAPWEHPTVPNAGDPEDFFVGTMVTEFDRAGEDQLALLRGSYHLSTLGHVNNQPPSTRTCYDAAVSRCPVPAISHEIGQYCAYPNFAEISKYNGVLRARNVEIFRERLKAARMGNQAEAFVLASGNLQWRLYKEEIEAALRTRYMAGFQLLDLRDFHDQGTAICGLLDVFWDEKPYVSADTFRMFCAPTVLLLGMPKRTWSNTEILEADVRIAHYGGADLQDAEVAWELRSEADEIIVNGSLTSVRVNAGNLSDIGRIRFDLSNLDTPARYRIRLTLTGTDVTNWWDAWVYPEDVREPTCNGVLIVDSWNADARQHLERGGAVVLFTAPENLRRSIAGAFQTDFWCFPMFRKFDPPGTLGLVCDPTHPIFRSFPTDSFADWQWWDLLKRSRPIILDGTAEDDSPIVQMIDNFDRNHKLGLLAEARVGAGKLLVSAIDLVRDLDKRIVARQLRAGILSYVSSADFDPRAEWPDSFVEELFRAPEATSEAGDAQPRIEWRGGAVENMRPGFALTAATPTSFAVTCPAGFNGEIQLKIVGDGACRVLFQGRLSATVEARKCGIKVVIPTAQNAWGGVLNVEIASASTDCRIEEWRVLA